MLPAYSHLSLIDAVDLVVNENPGQIVNTDLAAQALYGEVSGLLLKKAKDIVGRALWRGAEAERWQRVVLKM